MGQSFATLGIKIDSSQAATAATNLSKVTAAANDAEEAAGGTESAFAKVGEEFQEFVQHARNHVLALADASESTKAFTGILAHLGTPTLLAGAAIASLVVAYQQGANESRAFAQALASTGNGIGLTVGDFQQLAASVGGVVGNTGKAAAALTALAAAGVIDKEGIGEFATATVEASEKVGLSVEDIVKNFADLGAKPLEATTQLGVALGYLTPALYQQIQALQQQGKYVEAARIAQEAYSNSLSGQAKQLDDYTSIWERLAMAVGDYWDKVKDLGRQTPQQQIDALKQQLNGGQFSLASSFGLGANPYGQGLSDEIKSLEDKQAQRKAEADENAAKKQFATDAAALNTLELASLEAYTINAKAQYDAQTQDIIRAYQTQSALSQAQDDILEAQRSAGLLDDQQYYSEKIALIQKSGKAQQDELDNEIRIAKAQALEEAADRQLQIKNTPDDLSRINLQAQDEAATTAAIQHINDLQAQREQLATATSAKVQTANLAEATSVATLSRQYADLTVTTGRYVDQLQQQYKLTLSGQSIGDAARDYASQVTNILNHFQDQLNSNLDSRRNGQITQQQFDLQRQIISDSLQKSLGDFDSYYKALREKQSDWTNGVKDAFQNYIDQANNVAGLANTAFTNSFKDIEDSIVNFVTTGKFSFRDLTNSIIAELVRVEVKILESQALESIFGAAFGGGPDVGLAVSDENDAIGALNLSGARAGGGPVNAGSAYIVGEKGKELFVPNQSGTIVPNGQFGGGASVTVNSYNTFGSGAQVGAITAELDRRDAQIKADINNSIARGRWNAALRSSRA